MSMFEFPKYRRPHLEKPSRNPTRDSAAVNDAGEMPTESLSDLLGRVSENSTAQIDSLVGEFERLRGKLQTDAERIQREVEQYKTLSQQVMELTKTISGSVEKVRTSVDR